ncbi:MAG: 50S ribosomal protein L18 [Gemmatimonadota bacterium]
MSVDKARERRIRRARRQARLRRKIRGTAERPRLVVSRSLRHIEGQVVDDDRGVTLTGYSSRAGDLEAVLPDDLDGKEARAYAAGVRLAERARERGVEKVVFDRAGYPYHGRVKAFAEGARSGGLDF